MVHFHSGLRKIAWGLNEFIFSKLVQKVETDSIDPWKGKGAKDGRSDKFPIIFSAFFDIIWIKC